MNNTRTNTVGKEDCFLTYTEKIKDIESEVDKPTTTTTKKNQKKSK